ncbi:hypothetical protein MRX96_054601 [Rhipicephalus microplus]
MKWHQVGDVGEAEGALVGLLVSCGSSTRAVPVWRSSFANEAPLERDSTDQLGIEKDKRKRLTVRTRETPGRSRRVEKKKEIASWLPTAPGRDYNDTAEVPGSEHPARTPNRRDGKAHGASAGTSLCGISIRLWTAFTRAYAVLHGCCSYNGRERRRRLTSARSEASSRRERYNRTNLGAGTHPAASDSQVERGLTDNDDPYRMLL